MKKYLTRTPFREMAFPYQRTIVIRAYEVNEDVQWSVNVEIDWVKDKDHVNRLIEDYADTYPNRKFWCGLVPREVFIEELEKSQTIIDDYGSVAEWVKEYYPTSIVKESNYVFPILIDEKDPDLIDDGWNRCSYYLAKRIKQIPVVGFCY